MYTSGGSKRKIYNPSETFKRVRRQCLLVFNSPTFVISHNRVPTPPSLDFGPHPSQPKGASETLPRAEDRGRILDPRRPVGHQGSVRLRGGSETVVERYRKRRHRDTQRGKNRESTCGQEPKARVDLLGLTRIELWEWIHRRRFWD